MTIMTTKDDKALAAPAVADGWMSQFEELLDDYAGACAETAVFNVTQRSGMTVGMARPRRKALMAHVRSIAAAPSAPSVSADKHDAAEDFKERLADACAEMGIPDSIYESLCIHLDDSRPTTTSASVIADAISSLRDAAIDAADEWSRYVEVDNAPRQCSEHIGRAFDAAVATQSKDQP